MRSSLTQPKRNAANAVSAALAAAIQGASFFTKLIFLHAHLRLCYPYTLKPVQLTIETREITPQTALLNLSGGLMLGREGQELESTVNRLLAQGYRNFIFNLSGLTHIDSTGIGRCIASLNLIMQAKGKLHMAAAPHPVREGFRVTRLDRVFRFFEDVPAAQAALS